MTAPDGRDVRVFLAAPDDIVRRTDVHQILSPEDRAHVSRFRTERHQNLALASRALQRYALSTCVPVDASAWRFSVDEHGKPSIAAPTVAPVLNFSVANTIGLIACAVTVDSPIGVDVEGVKADIPMGVVKRCWSLREREALEALTPEDRPRRFVETWVAKEAYAKARGLGLLLDLSQVTVRFGASGPHLELDPRLEDAAERWHLTVWAPTSSHAAALCVVNEGRTVCAPQWMGEEAAEDTENIKGGTGGL
ncbi:MAG: 4'-phosphopantetheinyl transferase superfamily protein [Vicinamibacterales bacterium]